MVDKVKPCSHFDGKREVPGFKYSCDDHPWDHPCHTYDPLNEGSKKAAMKAALMEGRAQMEKLQKEVEEELRKEEFKKTVRGNMEMEDDDDDD